jgi:hypothetical protein
MRRPYKVQECVCPGALECRCRQRVSNQDVRGRRDFSSRSGTRQYCNLMTSLHQSRNDRTADIAGSTRHENPSHNLLYVG